MVKDPDGNRLFFRFYDPRIFKTFLPTCNGDQLAEVFGPVICYMQEENEPDTLLKFRQKNSEGLMIDDIGLT